MLTSEFHFLDEIISKAKSIEKCILDKIDLASAVLNIQGKQYSAIRVKYFPDYKQLLQLKHCFLKSGIDFLPYQKINTSVKAKINKLFTISELEPHFFIDEKEDHKGYIILDKPMDAENFQDQVKHVMQNTTCRLYDAVPGYFLINSTIYPIVRIYSEKVDLALLACLRKEFNKAVLLVG